MNEQTTRGVRKMRKGTVVSDKSAKTIVVSVTRRIRHPIYGKEITVSRKYHAHDEKGEAKIGDTVRIMECRPMSRLKRWRLVEVIARADAAAR
jgi:small subunit ribosomal protein S17